MSHLLGRRQCRRLHVQPWAATPRCRESGWSMALGAEYSRAAPCVTWIPADCSTTREIRRHLRTVRRVNVFHVTVRVNAWELRWVREGWCGSMCQTTVASVHRACEKQMSRAVVVGAPGGAHRGVSPSAFGEVTREKRGVARCRVRANAALRQWILRASGRLRAGAVAPPTRREPLMNGVRTRLVSLDEREEKSSAAIATTCPPSDEKVAKRADETTHWREPMDRSSNVSRPWPSFARGCRQARPGPRRRECSAATIGCAYSDWCTCRAFGGPRVSAVGCCCSRAVTSGVELYQCSIGRSRNRDLQDRPFFHERPVCFSVVASGHRQPTASGQT